MPGGQPTSNWHPQAGPSPSNAFNNTQLPQLLPGTPHQQNIQANNSQGNRILQQQLSNRSVSTPSQQFNSPAQNLSQGSPGMGNAPQLTGHNPQTSNGMSVAQTAAQMQMNRMGALPALPAPTFRAAYQTWCQKQNITPDDRMMNFEGKPIDLHSLHSEVLAAGSTGARVSQISFELIYVLILYSAAECRAVVYHRWPPWLRSISWNWSR